MPTQPARSLPSNRTTAPLGGGVGWSFFSSPGAGQATNSVARATRPGAANQSLTRSISCLRTVGWRLSKEQTPGLYSARVSIVQNRPGGAGAGSRGCRTRQQQVGAGRVFGRAGRRARVFPAGELGGRVRAVRRGFVVGPVRRGAGWDGLLGGHFKDQRADLELVAVLQRRFQQDADAVDQGAVAAAQVGDGEAPFGADAEQTVLAADPVADGADVTLRAAAENVFAGRKGDAFAGRSSLDHEQLGIHQFRAPSPEAIRLVPSNSRTAGGWFALPCTSTVTQAFCITGRVLATFFFHRILLSRKKESGGG